MREVILVTTYNRPELLHCCLSRIRKLEPDTGIAIFSDRGTHEDELLRSVAAFWGAHVMAVPDHNYYGNSYNTLEAFRWAYNNVFELVHYVEDDVFVHPDFFSWHREMHANFSDIFASMGWVFNRHAPITDDLLFQPWYYSIGTCFTRKKLELIVKHASPKYYGDMAGYIRDEFNESSLNSPYDIAHYEQDGLIQRIMDRDKSQTVSCGIAKCDHAGFGGYNRGWKTYEKFFAGCADFKERVQRIEKSMEDPYWRISQFGRNVVEREIGRLIHQREIKYRITLPGGWQSEFSSEMTRQFLPPRINSVPVGDDAVIELLS